VRISVIGAGGWGTAFALLLAKEGHSTTLWARDPEMAKRIDRERVNIKYLPGVPLPRENLASLSTALKAETIVLAVPSFAMAETLQTITPLIRSGKVFINLAKGLDRASKRTMSELIEEAVDARAVFTLSGHDLTVGKELQRAIASARFRIYLTEDIRGVELCATVKNIIALATGISDGLGYGDNSRGALITRGLAEMVRFGRAFAVDEQTFFGLSGLGDLVATCTSDHSRNRAVGVRIGGGEPLSKILTGMTMVAEGVYATRIVHEMAEELGIEMPITDVVFRILYEGTSPLPLVDEIMTREPKSEGA